MAIPDYRTYARRRSMSRSTLLLLLLAALLFACEDKEPVKTRPSATVSAAPAPTPTPPPTPRAPIVIIEDSAAMIGDARVDFAGPDVTGQIKAAVASKKIEGETINVIASKDAKAPKVAQVTNAIAAAKPKAI